MRPFSSYKSKVDTDQIVQSPLKTIRATPPMSSFAYLFVKIMPAGSCDGFYEEVVVWFIHNRAKYHCHFVLV